ncbi:hypothetical protein LTR36_008243 [Oleoguttula mirabilis]|uniref:Non-structural maintenance of chromosomes element 1 homolog n=1 Tax=Oleoguttula mirabilis TaxID=1507867 RepID=A0AAV9J8U0_9PEZI|nr:hypothetical protein LTR36_008243 [Oleoguttula mirabilis]
MSQDGAEGDYDNTDRAFLQALLARQTITYTDAKPLLAAIQSAQTPDRPTLPEDVSQEDFEHYVHALNAQISPFDLEIRSTLHQKSKDRIYALVNTTSDALTQMATIYTADELAFVKRVLDAMFETYNTLRAEIMALTSMQALKLVKPSAGEEQRRRESGTQTQSAAANAALTMSQAEIVLALLVEQEWFELSQKGFYTLSPRALMELRGWLMDTYNDQPPAPTSDDEDEEEEAEHTKIKFCSACREIVTMGQRCPDLACNARLHNHCVRNLFRSQANREECPMCKAKWENAPPVGEKAARQGAQQRRVTGGSTSGNAKRRTNEAAHESDAESGAEDD